METVLGVLVVTFAAARLTRLVTTDEITRPLRQWFVERLPEGSTFAGFLFCRWCVSVWVALPVAAVAWPLFLGHGWRGHWWIGIPAAGCALSYAIGLLVWLEPGD
ncbi:MAG: hypothetical protein JXA67_18765 [Micromonosporaceae bacterium]|nr:hypothetical protein [Micromonosporaceae bacterium]